jgi:hypothetical protein
MAKYVDILSRVAEVNFGGKMPANSKDLACLGAMLLQVPAKKKQALLTPDTSSQFVKAVADMYRFEIPVLEMMVLPVPKTDKESTSFSLN